MNLAELRKQRAKALEDMGVLVDLAKAQERNANDDESRRFNELDEEIRRLDAQIKQAERFEELQAERAKGTTSPVTAITVTREEGMDEQGNCIVWRSGGEQLMAVRRMATEPNSVDTRKIGEKLERSNRILRAASGAQESVLADGGFLVQQEFSTTLLNRAHETGRLASKVQRYSISSNANGLSFPFVDETSRAAGSRAGGIQAYWIGEADQYIKSKPKLGMSELKLKKLIGLCYMTDEIMEDASVLEQFITTQFGLEFGFKIDEAILSGDGVGKPLGILNSPALVVVPKETGQAAATLNGSNIAKMFGRLWEPSLNNAVFAYNAGIKAQLMTLSLTVGSNTIQVMLPGGTNGNMAESPRTSILGLPGFGMEQLEALGTQGDILLFDPTQYLWIDKGGVKTRLLDPRAVRVRRAGLPLHVPRRRPADLEVAADPVQGVGHDQPVRGAPDPVVQ